MAATVTQQHVLGVSAGLGFGTVFVALLTGFLVSHHMDPSTAANVAAGITVILGIIGAAAWKIFKKEDPTLASVIDTEVTDNAPVIDGIESVVTDVLVKKGLIPAAAAAAEHPPLIVGNTFIGSSPLSTLAQGNTP